MHLPLLNRLTIIVYARRGFLYNSWGGRRQALAGLLLPLLFVSSVVSELLQRSVRGAASAAVSVSGASSSDSGGGIGVLGGGGHAGMDLGRLLETAGDVFDTAFVAWSVWYMLRFFR